MWNKHSTRLFVSFSAISLVSFVSLSVFFSKRAFEREENYIQDLLSSRSQLGAFELENELYTGSLQLADEEKLERHLIELNQSLIFRESQNATKILGRTLTPGDLSILSRQLPVSGSVVRPCTIENARGQCSFTFSPKLNAWVFHFLPQSEFLSLAVDEWKSLFPLVLIGLGLAFILSFLLARSLNSPLRRFVRTSREISSGDYEMKNLKERESYEFEELRQVFRSMIQGIQDREREIRMAGIQLAHSERLATIGQLGASIAHEIKNPLMAMKGYSKHLLKTLKSEEEIEAAQIIANETDRCNQILQQMLRFSRRESNENTIYCAQDVIETCCLLLKSEAKKRQIRLEVKSMNDQRDLILGKPQELQQVMMNLIINAFQASPENSSVQIRTSVDEDWFVLEIVDQGEGIPEAVQPKIFDAFFTTKSELEGSGLGLSIVKKIIEEQGGQIYLESKVGQGSIFRIHLPLAKEHPGGQH